MLKYQLDFLPEVPSIELSLDVSDPNQYAPLKIEGGDDRSIAVLNFLFSTSAGGAFGHTFNPRSTTAIDLNYVLTAEAKDLFGIELVEGKELVATYSPGIPAGSSS